MSTRTFNSTIRPATEADVPAIHAMIRELAEFEKLLHEVEASEQDLREALFGARPVAEALVACVDAEPAGFALFFTSYSTFTGKPGIYLEDFFVRPRWRGLGLGKKLLRSVAAIAVNRGCARYEWSVLNWNGRAIDFYESCGAVMHSDWQRMRVTGEALRNLADSASLVSLQP
jgi:GNAT superfamily N-acetyltransferase